MSDDRPIYDIETVPRDGTEVDIFLSYAGSGHWVERVRWGELPGEAPDDDDMGWIKDGQWARGEDQMPTLWRVSIATKQAPSKGTPE